MGYKLIGIGVLIYVFGWIISDMQDIRQNSYDIKEQNTTIIELLKECK